MYEWGMKLWDDGNGAIHDVESDESNARAHLDYLRLFFEVAYRLPAQIADAERVAKVNSVAEIDF